MKTIVTHMSPDLDAIASSWLIHKYFPDWEDANIAFVPAGTTLEKQHPDDDPDIIHTDTGLGQFDHHQFADKSLCATRRVFDFLIAKKYIPKYDIEPLARIVDFVTAIDHFQEVYYHEPTADVYDFSLNQLIEGLKGSGMNDTKTWERGCELLEAQLMVFKRKVNAEQEIKNGFNFQSKWGKSIAFETKNEEVMKYSLKLGYQLVVRRDPNGGYIRIKTQPIDSIDLTEVYEKIKPIDKKASWFLHISKHMLLNGSAKNPESVPSSLTLKKVIEIIKNIE